MEQFAAEQNNFIFIYYFAGATPNPHYLMRRDNNSSDVVLSTLNRF